MGRPNIRRYDSCFYEISAHPESFERATKEEKDKLEIVIKLTKLKNINAYVYQGEDRYTAIEPVNNN